MISIYCSILNMCKYFLHPICSNSIVKVELDINIFLLIVTKKQEYKKQEPGGNSFEKTLDLANIKREACPRKEVMKRNDINL